MQNNGGGHDNHRLFWEIMSPGAAASPTGELAARSTPAFGSFDDFKAQLKDAGVKQFGSGWAWLIHDGSGLAIVGDPQPGHAARPRARRRSRASTCGSTPTT